MATLPMDGMQIPPKPCERIQTGGEAAGSEEKRPETTKAVRDNTPVQASSTVQQDKAEELQQPIDPPYSVFTHNEKKIIFLCAGLCAFFSPISSQIYFPSLPAIAKDLKVSYSEVNLTITMYLFMQGIAPAFIGGFSDSSGRRPAYLACFVIYVAANVGLAVQDSYAALMVLRCLQSAGSSGTVTLANAVVADLVTSQQRGAYVSYLSAAPQAGPSLGPVIGGLLGSYLGWHSIFYFLLICTGVIIIPAGMLVPETCRRVVDNGSIPPPRLSRSYLNHKVERRLIAKGQAIDYDKRAELAKHRRLRFPNPLASIKIIFTKEAGFTLFYIGILGCAFYTMVTLLPSQFDSIYGFNEIQIGLCYLPLGCGSLLASLVRGRFVDSRYRYHAKRLGIPLDYDRQMDLSNFPIEKARIEVALPTLALGAACMAGFGWMVDAKVNLAGPLIFLFVIGFCVSASINTLSVLLIDTFPGRAGAASAANNIVRCWMGAAATAAVAPLIEKIGIGWATTVFASLCLVFSPILWYVMKNGPQWRRAAAERKKRQAAERVAKANVGGGKGQQ